MAVNERLSSTEIGYLPVEWKVVPLRDVTSQMTNGFVGPAIRHYSEAQNAVLYLQGYNIDENKFNLHGVKFVTPEFHRANLKSCLRSGDMLTVQTGDVGLSAVVPPELVGSNCHALIISRFCRNRADSSFVCFYLNSNAGRRRLKLIETGTTMKHLNVGDMLNFLVPLPSLVEQQAIATALSDADAYIESLEQLITKKRQIKQGVMQELLTGKRRLPGFEGEWTETKLGELGSTYGGLSGKTKKDFGTGNARYITFMNVMSNVIIDCGQTELVSIQPGEFQNAARKGDIFFNGSSETPEEVGMCAVLQEEVDNLFVNSFCFGFRLTRPDLVSQLFLVYYLRSKEGRKLLYSLAQGATRHNLSKTALMQVQIRLPQVEEQIAIAGCISDIDGEILALTNKLAKARYLKQAMMQQLLTGRIRLV